MSLIHHLKLDETSGNFADSVGSLVGVRDPSGWVSSMPGFLEPGDRCPVFSLGGTYSPRILCGTDIWEGSGDKSLGLWVRTWNEHGDGYHYIFFKSGAFVIYTETVNSKPGYRFYVTDGVTTLNEHAALVDVPAGGLGWARLHVVKRASTYELWISGTMVWSAVGPSSIAANSEQFAIGNRGDGSPQSFPAGVYYAVNDFKVWDHALIESEIIADAWGEEPPDLTDPYLENHDPAPSETGVATTKPIYVEAKDDESDVDEAELEVYVKVGLGAELKVYDYTSGWQNGYTGSVVEDLHGGLKYYKITVYPPGLKWDYDSSVTPRVIAADTASNSIDENWTFTVRSGYPRLVSVETRTERRIRLTFDMQMLDDDELRDPANYSVTPQEAGAVAIYISEVAPENKTYPIYLDLIMSEMTDGKDYRAAVTTDGPKSRTSLFVAAGYNQYDFVGLGVPPTVLRLEAISATEMVVVFDEAVKDEPTIRDHTRYTFDKGLQALEVLSVELDRVTLKTTQQVPGEFYTLTVDNS